MTGELRTRDVWVHAGFVLTTPVLELKKRKESIGDTYAGAYRITKASKVVRQSAVGFASAVCGTESASVCVECRPTLFTRSVKRQKLTAALSDAAGLVSKTHR